MPINETYKFDTKSLRALETLKLVLELPPNFTLLPSETPGNVYLYFTGDSSLDKSDISEALSHLNFTAVEFDKSKNRNNIEGIAVRESEAWFYIEIFLEDYSFNQIQDLINELASTFEGLESTMTPKKPFQATRRSLRAAIGSWFKR